MKKEEHVEKNKFGHLAFIAGIIIAVLASFVTKEWISNTTWALLLLGVVVGFLNINRKEIHQFLVAATTLIVLSLAKFSFTQLQPPKLGLFIADSIGFIIVFVVPAALIVTLKAIWKLAED